jgi:uroporphyrinogen-III decarboxylase
VLPYDRRYIEEVQRRGLKTVYHNCGFSRSLLDLYTQLGTDAFETFPPPPVGDGDIALVKRVLGRTTVLLGNIDQVHLLRQGLPEDVYAVTRQTVLAGKEDGRYILMTADEVFPDTPIDNLRAMARAGRDHGRYE